MSEVVARLVTDSAVHQLEVENGRYTMRLYVRERNADRELTREQAGEWCDTVRVCGGYVRRGAMSEELAVMSDGLFPPTPAERLDILGAFIREERGHRAAMLLRHQDRREYWQERVAAADAALHHIDQLRKEIA